MLRFNLRFIDSAANFDNVFSNLCNNIIDIAFCQGKMDEAEQDQFSSLIITTPCCNSVTSLNSLQYNGPAGFAKFYISIENPKTSLNDSALKHHEGILKTPLKIIWAHF